MGDAEILHAAGVEIAAKHPVTTLLAELVEARRGQAPKKTILKYLLFLALEKQPKFSASVAQFLRQIALVPAVIFIGHAVRVKGRHDFFHGRFHHLKPAFRLAVIQR